MRLYYHPRSTCSRRVVMTLKHLHIHTEWVVVDLFKGEQNSPEFSKLNPNHQVPVLVHDGLVLWESYAIMQYLADLTKGQTLYPTDARQRADVNRWLFWCGQCFSQGVSILNWEHAIKPKLGMGAADPAEVARGEHLVTLTASILDAHLSQREWVCESGLSLADLAIAAPLADEHNARLPIADLPHLQRWLRQVQALECWKNSEMDVLSTTRPASAMV